MSCHSLSITGSEVPRSPRHRTRAWCSESDCRSHSDYRGGCGLDKDSKRNDGQELVMGIAPSKYCAVRLLRQILPEAPKRRSLAHG